MTYDEINLFVKNYIEKDKTGRAILLTSSWGTGKSHYIKNVLAPFLIKEEGGKHQCVYVSLYGMTELSDISKSIFTSIFIPKKLEDKINPAAKNIGKSLIKVAGKTLINGLSGKIGFDIASIEDKDLQSIIESIDLSERLLILDDVERTHIDILELLGFINNLCEHDNVKVLLIANESEIMKYTTKDENGKAIKNYSDEAIKYVKAKEKTIGDTIIFTCDYYSAISEIVAMYKENGLSYFTEPEIIREIAQVYDTLPNYSNLRYFIQTCQKTCDILALMQRENIYIFTQIEECIFYSLMSFMQYSQGDLAPKFPDHEYMYSDIGFGPKYPLFKFVYDYVRWQHFDAEEAKKANKIYSDYCKHSKWISGKDHSIQIIKNFYEHTEQEVKTAISEIILKLKSNDLPHYDYGIILNYSLSIKYDWNIDIDINSIEHQIITNLRNSKNQITFEELFNSSLNLHSHDAIDKFNSLKQVIKKLLSEYAFLSNYSYQPSDVDSLCTWAKSLSDYDLSESGFINQINIEKFVVMMKSCDASQLSKLRIMFLHVYKSPEQIPDVDINPLNELQSKLKDLLSYSDYDKIQLRHISIIIDYLEGHENNDG